MNLFELMTLNKHGRMKEVLFTSSLSYLLNPEFDHGFGDFFVRKFLEQIGITTTKVIEKVSWEERLKHLIEDVGRIDIFIETDAKIIGVEAKIWDDSAINNSKNDDAQLERYCKALKALSAEKNKKWMLVFLIPYKDAPKCIEEFKKISEYGTEYVKILVWNPNEKSDSSEYDNYYIKGSMHDLIKKIRINPPIDIQDRTSWLLESLDEYIIEFVAEKKSESRFPTKEDLKTNCPDLWKNLIEPFCTYLKRNVNSVHTTIGFPYGREGEKAIHPKYNNTLFRIRTTKKYYSDVNDKDKNYPDALEIEIWDEVFDLMKDDLKRWLSKISGISGCQPRESKHIDEKEEMSIMLLKIEKGEIEEEQVKEFEDIMKRGFKEDLKKLL